MNRNTVRFSMWFVFFLVTITTMHTAAEIISHFKNKDQINDYIFKNSLVAHALGQIGEVQYSNSLEAFNQSYNNGLRIFEVDLLETSDGVLVARHDWEEKSANMLKYDFVGQQSLEQFKETSIIDNLTPLTFEEILELLEENKDTVLILDTKGYKREDIISTYSKVITEAKAKNSKLLDRIIPQIYNRDMYYIIKEIYDFKRIWYTLYMDPISDEDLIDFVSNNDIHAVVMGDYRFNTDLVKKLNELNIYSFVHTINDIDKAKDFIENGVTGIYTDSLTKLK